jgi:hypothetical protein
VLGSDAGLPINSRLLIAMALACGRMQVAVRLGGRRSRAQRLAEVKRQEEANLAEVNGRQLALLLGRAERACQLSSGTAGSHGTVC